MPIFQYECPACGNETEILVMPGEICGDVLCPCHCYMRRLPASANFTIKGYSEANGYARKDNNE